MPRIHHIGYNFTSQSCKNSIHGEITRTCIANNELTENLKKKKKKNLEEFYVEILLLTYFSLKMCHHVA